MNQQLVQRTRYLLQTRFRRIRNAQAGNLDVACGQVLQWLDNHPILGGIVSRLDAELGEHSEEIHRLVDPEIARKWHPSRYYDVVVTGKPKQDNEPDFVGYTPNSWTEHVAACLKIARALSMPVHRDSFYFLAIYITRELYDPRNANLDPLEAIKNVAIRDLFEYLDERLDDINAINGLLQKYKQNAEWFQRENLQQKVNDNPGGERALALHLQEYIFNQGVDYVVEPASASGRPDFVLRDPNGQHIIIDAKYIPPGAIRSDVIKTILGGFRQVARYCEDFNERQGHLAVFVESDLILLLELEENDTFRYFQIGGNTIYFTEINIAERPTASKAGKAKQITISAKDLTDAISSIDS